MRVLVDTSVWIDHLRRSNAQLEEILLTGRVLIHSSVIGELACGQIKNRDSFLENLSFLPRATEATFEEVLTLISNRNLYGKGLGWVDMQLLASAALSTATLFTLDKRLIRFA